MNISVLGVTSGWMVGLLALGSFCLAYFIYVLAREHRYRRASIAGQRVEGRLVGRAGALPFRAGSHPSRAGEVLLLDTQDDTVPVIVTGPEARGLRAGAFITADGMPVTLLEESPYRQRAGRAALLASRILVGHWPELRWLRLPVAIGCLVWLLGLACLLFESSPSGRLFDPGTVSDVVPIQRR